MPGPLFYDRVKETTISTGAGAMALAGAVLGFRSFAAVGDGNTCYYCVESDLGDWEVGLGTYSGTGPTLARTTVLASSNAGGLVSLPGGTKRVALVLPAAYIGTLAGTNVSAYLSANQSLTQNVWQTVNLDTEVTDALGEFNPSTHTFTPASSGTYLVTFRVTIGNGSGRSIAGIWVGTSSELARVADGTLVLAGGTVLVDLTAGVGYTFRVMPTDPGTVAAGGASLTSLAIRRVG